MSLTNVIIPLVIEFFMGHFGSRKDGSGINAQVQLFNMVTSVVKKEISSLILKVAAAIVATGILLYSLIVLGQHLHAYMLLWENGPVFSVIVFAAIAIVCVGSLYLLFGEKKPVQQVFQSPTVAQQASFNLEKLYMNFVDGLAKGVAESHEQHQAEKDRRQTETPPQTFNASTAADFNYKYTPGYSDKYSDVT